MIRTTFAIVLLAAWAIGGQGQEHARDRQRDMAQRGGNPNMPNIIQMRKGKAPIPGGIGSGVTFPVGSFQVMSSSTLETEMFIHPNGLDIPSNWIYATSTNRTDDGVEVVGIYNGTNPGKLGVFDWSCSVTYPCPNGATPPSTNPSWRWTLPFADASFTCNVTQKIDAGGHSHKVMRYSNRTTKLDSGSPPLWTNQVYLWNYCDLSWELIYEHAYRKVLTDCSLTSSTCGWWGPIIETFFPEPQPAIKELGFENSQLFINGSPSGELLASLNTNWKDPKVEWEVLHRDPNHSWGVRGAGVIDPVVTDLTINIVDNPDPVAPGQAITYTVTVHNVGPSQAQDVVVNAVMASSFTSTGWSMPQGACGATSCNLGTLGSGQTVVTALTGSYTSMGWKVATVTVDPGNVVSELNETNNASSQKTGVKKQ